MAKPAAVSAPRTQVRSQYEALPYPHRNPDEELKTLRPTWLDRLDYLQSRYFDGALNCDSFRILIAGDGTGDASIYLAEQLYATSAQIIALDFSEASQAIAKARAAKRGLDNIRYLHASLLDLPKLGVGSFDYIVSCGVLHHLEKPEDGLKALASVLKPSGVMGVMVYGKIGRTGVYQAQEFLRMLSAATHNIDDEIALAQGYVACLPEGNWLKHNISHYAGGLNVNDKAGIYDLLLHSQDVAYTVSELYQWVESCGLILAELTEIQRGAAYSYNPLLGITHPKLRAALEALDDKAKQQACEYIKGDLARHFFYATKHTPPEALSSQNTALIPCFSHGTPLTTQHLQQLRQKLEVSQVGTHVVLADAKGRPFASTTKRESTLLFFHLFDGQSSIQSIAEKAMKEAGYAQNDVISQRVLSDLIQLIDEWRAAGILCLRSPEGKAFLAPPHLHQNTLIRVGAA